MRYLVDTDWVIDYLTGQESAADLLTALLPSGIAISIIFFSEIYEGILGSRDPKLAEAVFKAFLQQTAVIGVSRAVAKRNAQVRKQLRLQRRPIVNRAFDLLIAATALEHDMTLVTRNLDDYSDVAGLRIHSTTRA